MSGPDQAIDGDEQRDLLDRGWFAEEIAELAMPQNRDWSVRVGIYGPWGSGKTSIVNLVAKKLRQREDCVVVEFNPWGATDEKQMLVALMSAIRQQVEVASRLHGWNLRAHTGLTAITNYVKRFGSAHWSAEVAGSILDTQNADDLLKATANAAGKVPGRFVVLVDDLDRVRPDMVPPLLFALHTLLGVSGFTFVLAMDPTVVTSALIDYHGGFNQGGGGYLEKIVEHPRHIPDLSVEAKVRYAESCRDESTMFIPPSTLDVLANHLPDTPRSIRGLFRRLSSFSAQVLRFDGHELDYVLMVSFGIIEQISRPLWSAIIAGRELHRHMHGGWMDPSSDDRKQYDTDCEYMIRSSGVAPRDAIRARNVVDLIVNRMKSFSHDSIPSRLLLHANPQARPQMMTNREANLIVDELKRDPSQIERLVSVHAYGETSEIYERISKHVFRMYSSTRSAIVRAITSDEARTIVATAADLLAIMEAAFEAFAASWLLVPLLDVATDSLAKTPALQPLDARQQTLILRIAGSGTATDTQLGDVTLRLGRSDWNPESRALITEVRSAIADKIALDVVNRFTKAGAIEPLLYGDDAAKLVLEGSMLWTGRAGERLGRLLRDNPNSTVQANALAFLLALADGLNRDGGTIGSVDLASLWSAATTTPLGPGYLYRIVCARGVLEHHSSSRLVDPEWWSDHCGYFATLVDVEMAIQKRCTRSLERLSDSKIGVYELAGGTLWRKSPTSFVLDAGAEKYHVHSVTTSARSATFHVRSTNSVLYAWGALVVRRQCISINFSGYLNPDDRAVIESAIRDLSLDLLRYISEDAVTGSDE